MVSTSKLNYITPNKTIEETIGIIKDKILNKTPFALTRFGDGEIYILNRSGGGGFEEKNCKLWGYKYPQEVNQFYGDAGDIIKNAFVKSDIIGLMDPNTKIVSVPYSYNTWSIEKFKAELWGTNLKNIQVCDHMIARSPQLGNVNQLKNILDGASVNIVSPNTELLSTKKLEEKLQTTVNFTTHSKEINFRNRDEFLKSFENIKEDVVLLGVGLQKDYGVILRDEFGKIALDMGATMDAWAGIISRPWFNKGQSQEYLLM
jgi:hypothetical protein